MSKVIGKPPTHWRRPMTRTYDYNTTLGTNYYKPQLDYLESRKGRGHTPPSATTFAERLLKYPPSSSSRRSASASRRAEDTSEDIGLSAAIGRAEESLGRYASLDDLGIDEDNIARRRRQLLLRSSQENLDEGLSPLSPGTRRVAFGDKLLDAVGVREVGGGSSQQQSSSLSSSSRVQQQRKTLVSSSSFERGEEDALDKILAERKNRRQIGVIQSAEADLFTEDPLKSPRLSSRIQSARQQMDDMREKMRDDADASTSRFRSRIRQRREREQREEEDKDQMGFGFGSSLASSTQSRSSAAAAKSSALSSSTTSSSSAMKLKSSALSSSAQNLMMDDDDAETAAILSKVEEIRKRAKARMAAITDDFPDLQIESSLASRRAANRSRLDLDDDLDSDFSSSRQNVSSGRSATMSKRTLRVSYDDE